MALVFCLIPPEELQVQLLVTFGAPRVLCSPASDHLCNMYVRVVNENDIVPTLPPEAFGCLHGRAHVITLPTRQRTILSVWQPWTLLCYLLEVISPLDDHAIDEYVTRLEEWEAKTGL
jgi:hypothetical protein